MKTFTVKELPYKYDALEPHIDEETLKIHHGKHHQAYCDKFNKALQEANIEEEDILKIFSNISEHPKAVQNNGGGYWNHEFYWESMAQTCDGPDVNKEIAEAITKHFGSLEKFVEKFTQHATTLFGSGWTWLGVRKDGKLVIFNTHNQDNSYMDLVKEDAIPLLVIDVWEHAYYLKYQNKRPDYIKNFMEVINWNKVNERYKKAIENHEEKTETPTEESQESPSEETKPATEEQPATQE